MLCWFSRRCFSCFLTCLACYCVFLTAVFRAVGDGDLLHYLSFSICRNSLQNGFTQLSRQRAIGRLFISENPVYCAPDAAFSGGDAIRRGNSLCAQGLQSLRMGHTHLQQAQRGAGRARWMKAQDGEEGRKEASTLGATQGKAPGCGNSSAKS